MVDLRIKSAAASADQANTALVAKVTAHFALEANMYRRKGLGCADCAKLARTGFQQDTLLPSVVANALLITFARQVQTMPPPIHVEKACFVLKVPLGQSPLNKARSTI